MPKLNWLRNQCAPHIAGPLRIWGYRWMVRNLVLGLEREYFPLLRQGYSFNDDLGRSLGQTLPLDWKYWSDIALRNWLVTYAHQIAMPCTMINAVDLNI